VRLGLLEREQFAPAFVLAFIFADGSDAGESAVEDAFGLGFVAIEEFDGVKVSGRPVGDVILAGVDHCSLRPAEEGLSVKRVFVKASACPATGRVPCGRGSPFPIPIARRRSSWVPAVRYV
jgi:hypothetical protein